MQYQVPQFIDIEDKIVGPLTLQQFYYLGGGALLIFVSFAIFKAGFAILFTIPIAAASLGLAFGKVNGMPLARYIASVVRFAFRPQEYRWKKKQ